MFITGLASTDVGDDISLQCTYISNPYFPYDKHWPQWNCSVSGNECTENVQVIKLKTYFVLINNLTIKNVSIEDEAKYTCRMKYYNHTLSSSKYVFIKEKKRNHGAPRIYFPNEDEKQINRGENITLRCSGSRPVTWTVPDKGNTYYNNSTPDFRSGIYESHLHITEARFTNTGLYNCYESDSIEKHPHKSTSIYVFVKDENNLYVPVYSSRYVVPYTNVTVPCLPTSRDVNVSLSMVYRVLDPITLRSFEPEQVITPVIHAYHLREGFTVQMPGPGWVIATCTFVTETTSGTLDIDFFTGRYLPLDSFITAPADDLVFVGQTLELSCNVFVFPNVPDDALRWTPPNNFNSSDVISEMKRIKVIGGKVLINKLRINNINVTNEGRYVCHLMSNNVTAVKFISVYDQFKIKFLIENLKYTYAYIGQPLVLRCKMNVTHNVCYQMSWTTPNATEINNMDIKFIRNTRNTCGESILKIDNVTEENEGNYSCNVFHSTNRRHYTTKTILVKKGKKPEIVLCNFENQDQIVVRLQEPADLTCLAEGDPEPVITWLKNSIEVQELGIGFSANNSTLTVHSAQRIHAGLYTCIAQNPFGRVSRTVHLHVQTVLIESGFIELVIFFIISIIVVAVFFVGREYREKKFQKKLSEAGFIIFNSGEIQRINPLVYIAEHAMFLPYDTKWEIPWNSIELGRNLGSGYFGLVVEATVSNFFDGEPEKTVAVKMLHRYRNFIEVNSLICELKIMCHLGEHANLINLLGACTENLAEGKLLVVIEYCVNGCLGNYLIKNRTKFINLIDPDTELISLPTEYDESSQNSTWSGVNTLQLLRWALQVARGMEFLAARKVLHGDLAVRNILLDANYVAKISDFGMSKTLSSSGYYKMKSQCPLPVKWMAIESIRDKTFSTQSDVWAFGVVVWELFSLARTPYAELEPDFRFYQKLETGYRLQRPEYSTKEIYQVMRECWSAQPQCRPTFPCLVRTFTDLLQKPNKRCSGESEACASGAHSTALAAGQADDTAAPDWIALDILPPTCTSTTRL